MRALNLVVQQLPLLLLLLLRTLTAQDDAQRGAVTGVVVDHNGNPLKKALVLLRHEQEEKVTTTTDNGIFTIQHLALGRHTIAVSKDGYVNPAKRQQRVTVTRDTTTSITLTLQRTGDHRDSRGRRRRPHYWR